MSLILEALRKSEEQRRLGETPTLASVPAWTRPRQRPFWRPATVAVVILAAVAAGWWYGDRDASNRGETPARIVAREAERAAASPPRRTPAVITKAPPAVARGSAAGATRGPSTPRPVRAALAAPDGFANSPDLAKPAPPTQQTPYVPPDAALPAPLPDPENTAIDPAMPVVATGTQPTTPSPPPVAAAPPMAAAPPVAASSANPAVPVGAAAVPLIFELELTTRQALPPLKLNMHVFNADPGGRFVIIDGTRVVEGAPLTDNLTVVEIRPDGVVLDFRAQRFLLPRSGR